MNELTVNDYLDNLEQDRQDMINSLKSKGTEISDSATFTEIVPKIDGLVDINDYYDTNIKKQPLQDASGRILIYIKKLPQLDTSKSINLYEFLSGCSSLISVPQLDTSNVTVMTDMFKGCSSLISVPQLDASKVKMIDSMFLYNSNLTNFGGLLNLGQAYLTSANANKIEYRLYLSDSTKLTHESLMNVINNLYDIASKGCNPQQLVLGETNLAKLTEEEIAIATNKGWTVS